MFRTKYKRLEIYSESGLPEKVSYDGFMLENGQIELREVGVLNTYEEIQSHAESADINIMIARFLNGDEDVLSKKQMLYGDFSKLPSSYAELYNYARAGQRYFDSLPTAVKERFDNDVNLFMATFDTEEGIRKLGFTPKPSQINKEPSAPAEKGEKKE